MTYKTIFTAVSDRDSAGAALAQAAALAHANDGHLDTLAMGIDRTQTGYYYAGANAMILQETIARAAEEATEMEGFARAFLDGQEARWNCDTAVAQLADIGRSVAARARFSDLTVLPKPYGQNRGIELEATVEGALFEGQSPVLIAPDQVDPITTPNRVIVAWNESAEALVAIRAALPFLIAAETVHVVVVDPPVHGPNRSDPGGMISQFLARHGVRVEIDVLSRSMPRISDVLLRHAADVDADLIVMGAYGHSRFREAILGGATRNMLESATIPVFLAH